VDAEHDRAMEEEEEEREYLTCGSSARERESTRASVCVQVCARCRGGGNSANRLQRRKLFGK
jgi:hypothetical protein